jgi:molybdate transport system ATP-binding protein
LSERAPHHRLLIHRPLGALELHAELEFTAPWTVIFGPSGSGKSSLLRAACGLIPAVFASLASTPAEDLSHLPAYRRNLAYAPQGALLMPHLTVRQNVAFAATVRSQPSTSHAEEMLELFALTGLAQRVPRELSGGERQRVSLARAFAVPAPRLMLLDEPFTGIDHTLRDHLLPRLQQYLASRKIPAISVTHDLEEALLLNAEVIRLEAGTVMAQGPARHVLAEERMRALQMLAL